MCSSDLDFSDLIVTPDTKVDIDKSTVIVFDSAGADKTSYFIQKVTFSSFTITAQLVNGVDIEDYNVNFNGVGDSTGQNYNRILEVRVRTKIAGNL